jgi:hypothetical protein
MHIPKSLLFILLLVCINSYGVARAAGQNVTTSNATISFEDSLTKLWERMPQFSLGKNIWITLCIIHPIIMYLSNISEGACQLSFYFVVYYVTVLFVYYKRCIYMIMEHVEPREILGLSLYQVLFNTDFRYVYAFSILYSIFGNTSPVYKYLGEYVDRYFPKLKAENLSEIVTLSLQALSYSLLYLFVNIFLNSLHWILPIFSRGKHDYVFVAAPYILIVIQISFYYKFARNVVKSRDKSHLIVLFNLLIVVLPWVLFPIQFFPNLLNFMAHFFSEVSRSTSLGSAIYSFLKQNLDFINANLPVFWNIPLLPIVSLLGILVSRKFTELGAGLSKYEWGFVLCILIYLVFNASDASIMIINFSPLLFALKFVYQIFWIIIPSKRLEANFDQIFPKSVLISTKGSDTASHSEKLNAYITFKKSLVNLYRYGGRHQDFLIGRMKEAVKKYSRAKFPSRHRFCNNESREENLFKEYLPKVLWERIRSEFCDK